MRTIAVLVGLTIGIIASFSCYANATETIPVPLEFSEDCKNINIYTNTSVDNAKNECSVEVATKTNAFLDVMLKCHPKLGMVSNETCFYVISNLKVLIPLFNQIIETANKTEYKLGLNKVVELENLLNNEER